MKNSLACPKCQSRKLWRVEHFSTDDDVLGGRKLRVAVDAIRSTSFWVGSSRSVGFFDAYLCDACGYTEFWAVDFDELRPDPAMGVHFIDTSPEQGRFR